MKRLKPGILVYVEARDWEEKSGWQDADEPPEEAPIGHGLGRVEQQTADTLTLNAQFFPGEKGQRGRVAIPTGCVERVHRIVIERDPLWEKRRKRG